MQTKKETQEAKILRLLKGNGFVTNIDLNKVAFRYSARIYTLRREGWNIQKEYEKPGLVRYWLVPEREYGDVA